MGKSRKNARDERVTVTIDGALKRLLDERAHDLGISRSEATEQALSEWVRRGVESDIESNYGYGAQMESHTDRLASMIYESQIRGEMVIEALRYQFAPINELSNEELRRRARARRKSEGRGRQEAEAEESGETQRSQRRRLE